MATHSTKRSTLWEKVFLRSKLKSQYCRTTKLQLSLHQGNGNADASFATIVSNGVMQQ